MLMLKKIKRNCSIVATCLLLSTALFAEVNDNSSILNKIEELSKKNSYIKDAQKAEDLLVQLDSLKLSYAKLLQEVNEKIDKMPIEDENALLEVKGFLLGITNFNNAKDSHFLARDNDFETVILQTEEYIDDIRGVLIKQKEFLIKYDLELDQGLSKLKLSRDILIKMRRNQDGYTVPKETDSAFGIYNMFLKRRYRAQDNIESNFNGKVYITKGLKNIIEVGRDALFVRSEIENEELKIPFHVFPFEMSQCGEDEYLKFQYSSMNRYVTRSSHLNNSKGKITYESYGLIKLNEHNLNILVNNGIISVNCFNDNAWLIDGKVDAVFEKDERTLKLYQETRVAQMLWNEVFTNLVPFTLLNLPVNFDKEKEYPSTSLIFKVLDLQK